jgi:hypothetical protein
MLKNDTMKSDLETMLTNKYMHLELAEKTLKELRDKDGSGFLIRIKKSHIFDYEQNIEALERVLKLVK